MGNMIRCGKCGSQHYRNDPCPDDKPRKRMFKFDGESYCMIHCRPNSDVVQMTSNIGDKDVADRMADIITVNGGHVFRIVTAKVLIAALELIKKRERTA